MRIDELVNRAYTTWAHEKGTSWTGHMHAALTEQSETHAIELRAYETTVENLEQRIRELEAQRVPVVGKPVAWVVDRPLRHLNFSESTEIGLGGAKQEPLYLAPTHSIPAAELERLRKDVERYRWLRNYEKFNYRVHRAVQIGGNEMDEAIDAAIAQGKGE